MALAGASLLLRRATGEGGHAGAARFLQAVMGEASRTSFRARAFMVKQVLGAARTQSLRAGLIGMELAVQAATLGALAGLPLQGMARGGDHTAFAGKRLMAGSRQRGRHVADMSHVRGAGGNAAALMAKALALAGPAGRFALACANALGTYGEAAAVVLGAVVAAVIPYGAACLRTRHLAERLARGDADPLGALDERTILACSAAVATIVPHNAVDLCGVLWQRIS